MGKKIFNTFIVILLLSFFSTINLRAQECLPPDFSDVSNITSSTALILWEDFNGNSSWDLAISPNSPLEDPSTASIFRTITGEETITFNAQSLTPETDYYYYIRSNCGSSHSEWINGSFRTRCTDKPVPYSNNFNSYESTGSAFPECWTLAQGTSGVIYTDGTHINALQLRGHSTVVLPSFSLPINTLRIQFAIRADEANSTFQVGVMTDPGDLSTFSTVETITLQTPYTFDDNRTVSFSNYTGQGRYIALRNNSSSYQYIDNINVSRIPDCLSPVNVQATNVQANSATLTWEEEGSATQWQTLLSTTPITNFNNQNPNTWNSTTYPASNLLPNTPYYFYVRSRCSSDNSEWSSTSFTTRCSSTALPTSESFTLNETPECWACERVVGNADVRFVGFGNPPVCNPAAGNAMVMWQSSTNGSGWKARLKSLPLNTSGSSAVDVNFKWNHDLSNSYGVDDGVQIQYSTDGITWNNSTQGMIHRYDGIHDGWTEYDVIVPEAGNQPTVYIGFLFNTGGGGSNCYLDEVNFRVASGCYTPVNVSVTDINGNNATITWDEVGNATTWNVLLSETPVTDFTNTNPSLVSSPSYTASNLNPSTTYYAYVRSRCSSNSYSSWTVATVFTSGCGNILTFPYTESFDDYGTCSDAFPPCWKRHGQPDLGTYYQNGQTCYTPSATDLDAIEGDKSLMVCTPSGCFTYTITPPIQEDIRNVAITFFIKKSADVPIGTFEVGVMSAPNDPASFERITTIETVSASEWLFYPVSCSSATLSGSGRHIAFRHSGVSDNNYYLIDGVTIMEAPDCWPAAHITVNNITGNSASLSWLDPNEPATQWKVKISDTQMSDLTQAANVYDQTVSTSSVTVDYLAGNTTYHYYIQPNCNGQSSNDWSHGTFTTLPCNCYVDVFMEDAAGNGWNGAKIQMKHGTTVFAEVTMEEGTYDTVRVYTCEALNIDYSFSPGNFDSEISFKLVNSLGSTIYTSNGTPTAGVFTSGVPACGVSCNTAPSNLTATTAPGGNNLTWNATPSALSYSIYRNNALIADYVTATSYTDTEASPGSNCYTVAAKCIVGESNLSNVSCVTGIEDRNADRAVSIFPNPAKDRFTISADFPITRVSVVNLLGQEVLGKEVTGKRTEINVSEFPNGIYLVKILDGKSWIVRKIIVE